MKIFDTLKAIAASTTFKKNAVELLIVAVAAITGAIVSSKIGTTENVEVIDATEVL